MRKIYSQAIVAFTNELQAKFFEIMQRETPIRCERGRVHLGNMAFRPQFGVFEGSSKLAYFDPCYGHFGFNKRFLYEGDRTVLYNILRHEIAHMITFLRHGGDDQAHGPLFQKVCKELSWTSPSIMAASMSTEEAFSSENPSQKLVEEGIVEKIKKLLRLGESSNPHEAQLATLKAQELLMRYKLSDQFICSEASGLKENLYTVDVLEGARSNAKWSAISKILETFMVYPIFVAGYGTMRLQVAGSLDEVQIAEYLAQFLDQEFERLWKLHQREHPHHKGMAAKNSFFRGVAAGYCEKVQRLQKKEHFSLQKELIALKDSLSEKVETYFPHLRTSTSRFKQHREANQVGKQVGKKLSIHTAVKSSSRQHFLER